MKKKLSSFVRFTEELDDAELQQPNFLTVLKLVWHSIRGFFVERPGQIIGSAFILLMLWGYHGQDRKRHV